jgi:hypothetical protein
MAEGSTHLDTDPLVDHLAHAVDMPLPNAIDWLCRHHGLDPKGDQALCSADDPNIVFDGGLSDAGLSAAFAIHADPRIEERPLTGMEAMLIYGCDGARMMLMPMVKRPPRDGYRSPHWLPGLVKLAAT